MNRGTLVGDWMTEGVVCVAPDATIEDASRLMESDSVRRLPVTRDGRAVGVLSAGDLRAALSSLEAQKVVGGEALVPRVEEVMTPDPITIPPDASLALAAQTMLQLKVSGLPVVDEDGQLIGVISASDLFRYIIATC